MIFDIGCAFRALIDGRLIDAGGQRGINASRWTGGDLEDRRPPTNRIGDYARPDRNDGGEILSSCFARRVDVFPLISPDHSSANIRIGLETYGRRRSAFVETVTEENYDATADGKAFCSGARMEPSFRRCGAGQTNRF